MPGSAPPLIRSGGKTSSGRAASCRLSMVAPIWRSGAASRAIGRRVSDTAPASVLSHGRPARSPARRRIVGPELPQSRAADGPRRPSKPPPWTRAPSPSTSTDTPSAWRSEEHTSELQSQSNLVCRLLLEKKKKKKQKTHHVSYNIQIAADQRHLQRHIRHYPRTQSCHNIAVSHRPCQHNMTIPHYSSNSW